MKHKNELNTMMIALKLPVFREAEVDFIEEYIKIMAPIAIALDRLQADKHCFYGCMLPTLLAVEKKLANLRSIELRYCQPLLNSIVDGFKKLFSSFINLDFYSSNECKAAVLASATNPQFKLKWLTIKSAFNNENLKKKVKDMVLHSVKNLEKRQLQIADEESEGSADDFFEYAHTSTTSIPVDSSEMEVLKFFSDQNSTIKSLNEYPNIKKCIKYNTALPSSAPVERLFSLAGHIHSPKRYRLSDKLFCYLVFLKGNSKHI